MFQRDYILRMIEQLTEAVGYLLGLKRKRNHAEALRFIDDWFERHLRMRLGLIDKLLPDDLVRLHAIGGVVDTAALQATARLLKEAADIQDEIGEEDAAYHRRVKSLQLYIKLTELQPDTALDDPDEAAEALLAALKGYALPPEAVRAVALWRERSEERRVGKECRL